MSLIPDPGRPAWQTFLDRLRPRRRRPKPPRARVPARPSLERFEDRLAPAVFNVSNSLALADAIQAADTNADLDNTILVAPGTYTVVNQKIAAAFDKTLTVAGQGPDVVFTANQQGR